MKTMPEYDPRPAPPRWAVRLLEWFCAPHLLEELRGDLEELYAERVETLGVRQANHRYARDVLSLLRPFAMKRKPHFYTTPNATLMLNHYFTVAIRNLVRNKTFSAINMLGLSLGMAAGLLLFLWVGSELRVNRYHVNGPQLYHVMARTFHAGNVGSIMETQVPLPDVLRKEVPELVHVAGFTHWGARMTFSAGDKVNKQQGDWAGADWFRMFSVPLLAGTTETALNSPNSLAISRKMAENYFGSVAAALGKSMRVDNQKDYQVTAVFENHPPAEATKYDFLLSWQDLLIRNPGINNWGTQSVQVLVQLHPDATAPVVEAKIRHLLRKHKEGLGNGFDMQLFLHAYEDAYLYSHFQDGYPQGGRIEYVRLFGLVAVFILLIASINFMNLATARSVKRAREVGVRKAVGAARGLLIGQFVGEAMLLTFVALLLALLMVAVLLPAFNSLTGKDVALDFTQGSLWALLLGVALATGLVAGSYPALFLSSLQPVRVLKGTLKFGSGARVLRQGLVVFQFVLSMLLVVSTVVVYRQMDMVQTRNLGYERGNLIYLPAEGELGKKYDAFREELLRTPDVERVSYMSQSPAGIGSSTDGIEWPGKDPKVSINFMFVSAGHHFTQALKVKLEGRDFSPAFGNDSASLVINRAAARQIGYTDPVGKTLTMWGQQCTIVGVMDDFHFQSLRVAIQPLIVRFDPNTEGKTLLVATRPGRNRQALASLKGLWRQFNPRFPFAYQFADEEYQQLYQSEMIVGTLANYFAGLAVFISCLGLLGLSAFTAEQRTKEIGLRKVFGASAGSVAALLSKDLLKLVLIAILLASPVAWYLMNRWLADFEYRVRIEWWMFALAGGLAVVIALLTVSFQSIKAALVNPGKSLRSE